MTRAPETTAPRPKLYDQLAAWWPLLSSPADYAEEAAFYEHALIAACETEPRTLLELGSGGGNNASYMKRRFRSTLVDPSPGMLGASRALNPECEHLEGDMRTVRLGREFDVVFIHDAICYMTKLEDLRLAVATAFAHCRPGGAALFAPDFVRETFQPSTSHGGEDEGVRGLRYLQWTWDPDPSDTTYLVEYAYLLRTGDGAVRAEHDRHVEGLFPRATWMRIIGEAGFEPACVEFEHSEVPYGLDVFVGKRQAAR